MIATASAMTVWTWALRIYRVAAAKMATETNLDDGGWSGSDDQTQPSH